MSFLTSTSLSLERRDRRRLRNHLFIKAVHFAVSVENHWCYTDSSMTLPHTRITSSNISSSLVLAVQASLEKWNKEVKYIYKFWSSWKLNSTLTMQCYFSVNFFQMADSVNVSKLEKLLRFKHLHFFIDFFLSGWTSDILWICLLQTGFRYLCIWF